MKVVIIVFSPTGNTLKVGNMLRETLMSRGAVVQLIDIARNKKVFRKGRIKEYIKETIEDHDVLCIGGPVYAHHLHYNVKDIIKSLPSPGNGWGRFAIPFVTYGRINSGIALSEAAKLLKRSGRITVAGMKVNSCHCFTKMKEIKIKINEGMPGEEAIPLIEELADRIVKLEKVDHEKCIDISQKLGYQSRKGKIKANLIFREKLFQRIIYPKLTFDPDKCKKCGMCAKVCPVQCIEMTEDGPVISKDKPSCIHCVSCILNCKYDAISFDVNWTKWNKLIIKAAKGEGPLASNEEPKSVVYPIV
jgi:Fe-S-cluster-containing hydrogenase component 2/flavodoxin